MQADKAEKLRKQWISKGNPPCNHPVLDNEYMGELDTGDRVCKTCGQYFMPCEIEVDPQNHK